MAAQTAFRSDERFTQRQFRRWVEDRPRSDINHYELIDGRIVMTPPAGWTHAHIEIRLAHVLEEHVAKHGLGRAFGSSAGYDLPSGDTVEPDASFVSADRFAANPPRDPNEFLRIVPNLVVEILSPGTAKRDRTEKKEIYERNGVEEYWVVDPPQKTVTVFGLEGGRYSEGRVYRNATVRSRVLSKLRVSVERLFAD